MGGGRVNGLLTMNEQSPTLETASPGVALIILRRPRLLNALTWEDIRELDELLSTAGQRKEIRVVVITGEGRGFCSGLDLGGDDAIGSIGGVVEVYDRQELVASLATTIHGLAQPVIAAVNGPVAGGGMAIALAADLRVCARSATFVASFIRVGLSNGDVGASYLLPRIVGYGMASELLLTGRPVEAEEASRIGLANRVVDDGETLAAALELAALIMRNSPFGVRMTKKALARNIDASSLESAIELENRTQVLATRTDDMREALAAFREKRSPKYQGT
jgi:enoyl-CoA hydratase